MLQACVKEELEDKQESPEESIKPGSAQLVFDQVTIYPPNYVI